MPIKLDNCLFTSNAALRGSKLTKIYFLFQKSGPVFYGVSLFWMNIFEEMPSRARIRVSDFVDANFWGKNLMQLMQVVCKIISKSVDSISKWNFKAWGNFRLDNLISWALEQEYLTQNVQLYRKCSCLVPEVARNLKSLIKNGKSRVQFCHPKCPQKSIALLMQLQLVLCWEWRKGRGDKKCVHTENLEMVTLEIQWINLRWKSNSFSFTIFNSERVLWFQIYDGEVEKWPRTLEKKLLKRS